MHTRYTSILQTQSYFESLSHEPSFEVILFQTPVQTSSNIRAKDEWKWRIFLLFSISSFQNILHYVISFWWNIKGLT